MDVDGVLLAVIIIGDNLAGALHCWRSNEENGGGSAVGGKEHHGCCCHIHDYLKAKACQNSSESSDQNDLF